MLSFIDYYLCLSEVLHNVQQCLKYITMVSFPDT